MPYSLKEVNEAVRSDPAAYAAECDALYAEKVRNAAEKIADHRKESHIILLSGPSGSGKTTLMNLIGCLDVPTSGEYELDGRNLKDLSDNALADIRNKHIGFVFQSYNLIPHQSVLSNVELALTLSGVSKDERRKRAISALKKVGLEDHIYKRPNQLSGGQMQRVAIARALVNDPDILLADEPTGALDYKTGKQILNLLQQTCHNTGMTVVIITHNQAITPIADRIITMRSGKVIQIAVNDHPVSVDNLEW